MPNTMACSMYALYTGDIIIDCVVGVVMMGGGKCDTKVFKDTFVDGI